MSGVKVAGKTITINLDFTDTHRQFVLQVKHSVLNYFEGKQDKAADLTLHLSTAEFGKLLTRAESFPDAMTAGEITTEGNPQALAELAGLLDTFDFWFNIIEP